MKRSSVPDPTRFCAGGKWFRALSMSLQEALVAAGNVRFLEDGERLFAQGDASNGLFAVLLGKIRIKRTAHDGGESVLSVVPSPGWFGEVSVLDGLPRSHDAVADGEATVLEVPQAALDTLLAQEPRYWRDLAVLMAHKVRLMFATFEETSALPISARLAKRLVTMADGYGDWHGKTSRVVNVKQRELAALLGVTRQTVNQALRKLVTDGVLEVTYGEIVIVDHDALRSAAMLPPASPPSLVGRALRDVRRQGT